MKHCLVIDDSNMVRTIARQVLEGAGCRVSEAEAGPAALAVCISSMPDVIFLDWRLPSTTASDFLCALRMLPGGAGPRVVYCTTVYDPVDISDVLAEGADDYMLKPFDRTALLEKLPAVA